MHLFSYSRYLLPTAILTSLILPLPSSYAKPDISGDLAVFHAGSLSVPFREIAAAFQRIHPDINVLLESAGSRASARKISDLNRNADVMGSADYTVIDSLLIPEHASWNIRFAANEMVLAYTPYSRWAEEITDQNWYQILLKNNIAYGRSDPNSDPCGYRTVLTAKLAETYYEQDNLAGKLLAKDQRHIRPKETDLLALLEAGEIDYVFNYRSVAQQHHLQWITLPDEINLKNPEFSDQYATATVKISGTTPGSFITKTGSPMVYGVTIPKNAPNPAAAVAFVTFLLGKEGLTIMERNGQPTVVPTYSSTYSEIPYPLKRFARDL
jgi:molybdate/tungstate transport system substrate-binding protein|tara:strand:+ start:331 stop:1305 length:975 start_codon:yes stop_codon:yes gene_type:complete